MGWTLDQQSILRTTYSISAWPSFYYYLFKSPTIHQTLLPFMTELTKIYPPENPINEKNFSKIFQVACGEGFVLILTENGKVLGMGDNFYSQMGNVLEKEGGKTYFTEFEELKGIPERIVQIDTGFRFSMCLSDDGKAFASGANDKNQFDFEAFIHERESGKVDMMTNGFSLVNTGFDNCLGVSLGHHFSIFVGMIFFEI